MTYEIRKHELLLVFDEQLGGACTRLRWRGRDFLVAGDEVDSAVAGISWYGVVNGEEVSQTGYVLAPDWDGYEQRGVPGTVTVLEYVPGGTFDIELIPHRPDSVSGLVGRLRVRYTLGYIGNPNVIEVLHQFRVEDDTSAGYVAHDDAPSILASVGASKVPHYATQGAVVALHETMDQSSFVVNMPYRLEPYKGDHADYISLRTEGGTNPGNYRNVTYLKPVPEGDPVLIRCGDGDSQDIDPKGAVAAQSGDGSHCIAVYRHVPAAPIFGIGGRQVRWRRDRTAGTHEMGILENAKDGVYFSAGMRTRRDYVIVGSVQDVETAIHQLYSHLEDMELLQAEAILSGESPLGIDPALLV